MMGMVRTGVAAAWLAGGVALAQPPAGPAPVALLESAAALKMDGAYALNEVGLDRPTIGIDKAALGWVMSEFYPPASLRAREEGVSTVVACVDARGKVAKTGLLTSSGFPRLDQASLTMMSALPMKAATLNGKAVAFCGYTFSVFWKMPDSAPQPQSAPPG